MKRKAMKNVSTKRERVLNFKDICGYLPYGLKMVSDRLPAPMEIKYATMNFVHAYDSKSTSLDYGWIKPVLRPLADLYRIVSHNGENIPDARAGEDTFEELPPS